MRPNGTQAELERRRRRAVAMFQQGLKNAPIARALGVRPQSVGRWRRAWQRGGEPGVKAKRVPGRPPRLSQRQRRGLQARLTKGARSQGFGTELWTCRRVQQLIQRCYGVHYHVNHLSKLLRGLGFSPSEASASGRRTG